MKSPDGHEGFRRGQYRSARIAVCPTRAVSEHFTLIALLRAFRSPLRTLHSRAQLAMGWPPQFVEVRRMRTYQNTSSPRLATFSYLPTCGGSCQRPESGSAIKPVAAWFGRLPTKLGTFSNGTCCSSRNLTRPRMPRPIQIDEEQNRAIRTQIAKHLRTIHSLEGRQRVPRTIRQSIDRMAELEQQIEIKTKAAPPLVPSLDEGWPKRIWPRRLR